MTESAKKEQGRRLRQALKRESMKQVDLVDILQKRGFETINQSKMCDYVNGRRSIPTKSILHFSEILHVNVRWLMVLYDDEDIENYWKVGQFEK